MLVREKPKQPQLIKQGYRVSELLAFLVREHSCCNKTSQTRKIRKIRTKKTQKPTGVLKNVMQEDQKGCKENNVRTSTYYVLKRNR